MILCVFAFDILSPMTITGVFLLQSF